MRNRDSIIIINGSGIGDDIAIGKVFYYSDEISVPSYSITEAEIEKEYQRFDNAIEKSKKQIDALQSTVQNEIGEILSTHIIMLNDKVINGEVKKEVAEKKKNVDSVYNKVMLEYVYKLRSISDPTLAERANDILDIRNRMLKNLNNIEMTQVKTATPAVIVAKNLTPSDTLKFRGNIIAGFAVENGGVTSHAAILARSLGIPAVVGLKHITSLINVGDMIIVDGKEGRVIINPSEKEKEEYKTRSALYEQIKKENQVYSSKDAITLDGIKIKVQANIDSPDEAAVIKNNGAEGVGLYRTECLYIRENSFPSEEEQFQNYKTTAENVSGEVTIRTLDIGGDKFLTDLEQIHKDENPFLGWRAIRFCLANVDLFKIQLRSIIRASAFGSVRIMIPMISVIEELIDAKKIIEEVKKELRSENILFDENIKIGIMLETPSATLLADEMAKEADFFSIGSNDLIQYTLACDRTNERVGYLYEPLNAAVLKLIKIASDAAKKHGIDISICGEMAGQVMYVPVLIGLGVRNFSMPSYLIPRLKKTVSLLNASECEELAEKLLTIPFGRKVKESVSDFMRIKCPFIFQENLHK